MILNRDDISLKCVQWKTVCYKFKVLLPIRPIRQTKLFLLAATQFNRRTIYLHTYVLFFE